MLKLKVHNFKQIYGFFDNSYFILSDKKPLSPTSINRYKKRVQKTLNSIRFSPFQKIKSLLKR